MYNNFSSYNIQARIHEWAEMTFGSALYLRPLWKRIFAEVHELQEEVDLYSEDMKVVRAMQDSHLMDKLKGECADIVITLFRFAGALGFDLLEEVERKQDINEQRKWRRHGDGTGQHIKNTDNTFA